MLLTIDQQPNKTSKSFNLIIIQNQARYIPIAPGDKTNDTPINQDILMVNEYMLPGHY